MKEVLVHYKIELARRGRKIKQLSDKLGMDYSKVTRIINGYDNVPDGFDTAVQKILAAWDNNAI